MNNNYIPDVVVEDARIMFKNFAGNATNYNPEGQRNFCVQLDPELATKMIAEGWNVKYLKPRDEYEAPQAYIKVKVVFGKIPPKVVMINPNGIHTTMTEDTVGSFDYAKFTKIDLIFRPYIWESRGQKGVTAYLKTMYATLDVDPLESKYSTPDFAVGAEDPKMDLNLESDKLPF